ncbi:MAG: hypothetical protein FJ264_17025 [Planctomycetes bacterium]|nr:hypothetical protein [Planctomycetota bacterium]
MINQIKEELTKLTIEELKGYIQAYGKLQTFETVSELEEDIERLEAADEKLKNFEESLGYKSKGIAGITGGFIGFFTGYKLRKK